MQVRHHPLLWLLVFVPVVFAARKLWPDAHAQLFVLVVPSAVARMDSAAAPAFNHKLSVALAVLLLVAYGLGLLFSFKTHRELFASAEHTGEEEAPWPIGLALATLAGVTVLVALVSEVMVYLIFAITLYLMPPQARRSPVRPRRVRLAHWMLAAGRKTRHDGTMCPPTLDFRRVLLPATCSALLVAGCAPEGAEAPTAPPPEVRVATPVQRDVPIVREWLATLDGSANVSVKPRVQGYLTKVLYTPGKQVKAGEVLFEIDARPFVAALAQAEADLARFEAVQTKAELDANRQIALFATKAVSEQDRDAAVQNNEAAKANVLAAKANVELARINLEFTKVTSPIAGIAGISKQELGDLVGPGSSELTAVSTVDPIKAVLQISEREYLAGAKLVNDSVAQPLAGREATLELVLADGEVFAPKGRFYTADRQVDQKTGTFRIETLFPNPGNVLRPGFFARVRVVVMVHKDALLVPQRAVTETQGNYHLVVIGEGDIPEIRPVKVGERVGSLWVVTDNLKPAERVVVEGIQKARPGVPVVATPWVATQPAPATPAAAAPAAAKPQPK